MGESNRTLPRELRRRLPRFIAELAKRYVVGIMCIPAFAVIFFVFTRLNNGWLYTLPPLLGPLVASGFFMWRPLNPYDSIYAEIEGLKRSCADADGWIGTQLASGEARRVVLFVGLVTSMTLGAIALGVTILAGRSADWGFNAGAVVVFTCVIAGFTLPIHCHVLLRWLGRIWRDKYRTISSPKG